MNKKRFSKKVAQLRLIWVGARELGLDADELHGLLRDLTGAESLSSCSDQERALLIRNLEKKAAFRFRSRNEPEGPRERERRPGGTATDMITEAQAKYLSDLWDRLAALEPDFERPQYRAGFTRQLLGDARPWPQTRGEAAQLIEALKRRHGQATRKAFGPRA